MNPLNFTLMKTNRLFQSLCLMMMAAFSLTLCAQAPAFPTAEGYGKWATGGRGGRVVEVTNLSDNVSYPPVGSFRWALQQYPSEPLTVVFRVSGVIRLAGDIRCGRTAGTTIAGQTAPGDGICIRGAKCNFGGSKNLIIRHLRFRVGLGDDGDFIPGGSIGIENGSNWIIDHCTFGWSGEENMTIYDNTLTTVQWCIVHEGLYDAGHGKGARGYGSQWGGQSATYHHNLLAHNMNRSPRFNGARSNDLDVLIDYVNNVNYDWGNQGACYGGDLVQGNRHRVNMVNNYYKPGPAYPGSSSSYFVKSSFNENQKTSQIPLWYMNGNYMEGTANVDRNSNNYNGLDASQYTSKGIAKTKLISEEHFEVSDPVMTETAQEAYESVLLGVGAFPRDTVDRRIIEEVRTGKAFYKGSHSRRQGIIDSPEDVGGYPDYQTYNEIVDADHDGMDDAWELAHGLNPADAMDGRTILKSGYSVLDVYLNSLCGEEIPMEYAKPYHFVVAQDGSGDFKTINEAIEAVPDNGERALIFVKAGTYKEKVFIGNRWQSSSKVISLIGEDMDKVIITWDDYQGKSIEYPGKGTITADGTTCPTMIVTSPDFYMENITVENTSRTAQAIALYQCGDRQVLNHCRITGYQDTHRTKKTCRYFYYKCTIEGAVDFIYAGGLGYFYQCKIVSTAGGYVTAPEDTDYSSRLSDGNPLYYNFFFHDCDITAASGVGSGSCYLGRPWGEKSGSVYMNCRIGSHINAAGWTTMGGGTEKNCCFAEYQSLNANGTALADVSKRVAWSRQISENDRYNLMTLEKIFAKIGGKKNPFDPIPMIVPVEAPKRAERMPKQITAQGGFIRWIGTDDALGYVIYKNGSVVGFSQTPSFSDPAGGNSTYKVRAINAWGALSADNDTENKLTADDLYAALNPIRYFQFELLPSDTLQGRVEARLKETEERIESSVLASGTEIVLSAVPAEAYVFSAWLDSEGDTLSVEPEYVFPLSSDLEVEAAFSKVDGFRAVKNKEVRAWIDRQGCLQIDSETAWRSVSLFDVAGRQLFRGSAESLREHRLPVSALYLLKLEAADGRCAMLKVVR